MAVQLTDGFELVGDQLEYAEVEAIKEQGKALINQCSGTVVVKLAGLERANSVTVALLVAWFRAAKLQKKSIEFLEPSTQLYKIIDVSGLSAMLLNDPQPLAET